MISYDMGIILYNIITIGIPIIGIALYFAVGGGK